MSTLPALLILLPFSFLSFINTSNLSLQPLLPCDNLSTSPTSESDCTSHSLSDGYCCYATSPGYFPYEKRCVKITKDEYRKQREVIDEYGGRWKLKCKDGIDYAIKKGSPCGGYYPTNPIDCWLYSTESKSCCFKRTEDVSVTYYGVPAEMGVYATSKTECVWNKKEQGNVTRNGDKLWCSSRYINNSILRYNVILILLFVFIAM